MPQSDICSKFLGCEVQASVQPWKTILVLLGVCYDAAAWVDQCLVK